MKIYDFKNGSTNDLDLFLHILGITMYLFLLTCDTVNIVFVKFRTFLSEKYYIQVGKY